MSTRRSFIRIMPVSAIALLSAHGAFAADLDPKDAQALALGFVTDATKADKSKFPKYAAGQICSNCQLYQGKPSDAAGPCVLFAGKVVSANAWCGGYVKKA